MTAVLTGYSRRAHRVGPIPSPSLSSSCSGGRARGCGYAVSICSTARPFSTSRRTCRVSRKPRSAAAGLPMPKLAAESERPPSVPVLFIFDGQDAVIRTEPTDGDAYALESFVIVWADVRDRHRPGE